MFKTALVEAFTAMGMPLSAQQIEQFCTFNDMLVETNKVMNLTAITEPKEVAIKHMADSVSCYDGAYFPQGATVLDLGTGAGFPGIPLAILRPDLEINFFDSLQKRLTFLEKVVQALGLPNCTFLHGRAEEMAHQAAYREAFDIVTSRAVARLPILAEWALPYVKLSGTFISLKGAQYEDECAESTKALSILGGTLKEVSLITLPGLDDVRAVVYITKTAKSPKKYPRKPKMAAKNPL